MPRQPINPITMQGQDVDGVEYDGRGFTIKGINRSAAGDEVVNVTIGRLWINPGTIKTHGKIEDGPERIQPQKMLKDQFPNKHVQVLIWKNEGDVQQLALIEEEHFINGLKHLFPNKELEDK